MQKATVCEDDGHHSVERVIWSRSRTDTVAKRGFFRGEVMRKLESALAETATAYGFVCSIEEGLQHFALPFAFVVVK